MTTTIQVGEKVTYWRDKRPLLPTDGHYAEVVSVEGARARLLVSNARTGRTFYADAELAESMEPGRFTRAKEAAQATQVQRATAPVAVAGRTVTKEAPGNDK
jgi:hypothetical protein